MYFDLFSKRDFNIIGNIGNDPKIEKGQSNGKEYSYIDISLAANKSVKNKETGSYNSEPQWFHFRLFDFLAERAEKLKKGDKIELEGEIENHSFEKDNVKHNTFKFIPNKLRILKTADNIVDDLQFSRG